MVNNLESLNNLISKVRAASVKYATYTQEQVDHIFQCVAMEANKNRITLAKMAYNETKMGVLEDKVIKNHFACENVYNTYKNTITCGTINKDEAGGYEQIAYPIGLIGAIIPTTNPTSTAIFKILIALKTRNAIIISAHPKAKHSTNETARILLNAAIKAGAPEDIIGYIDEGSLELTTHLMKQSDLILATGGEAMVRAAYSSGTPAVGVGPGNVPALIDDSADIKLAVNSIIHSKTFDNGMICASEQAVIVVDSIYEQVKEEFSKRGCYFLKGDEVDKIRKVLLVNGSLNAAIVGASAYTIASLGGVSVPLETKIIIGEVESDTPEEAFSHEKLSPVLGFYKASSFTKAVDIASNLVYYGGMGHSASVYLNEQSSKDKLDLFVSKLKACRILVNTPSAFGGIGDVYNFLLAPSLTLGCGSWGGNSVSENVGVKHLLNIKTVAIRRENMQWLRVPSKIYLKANALSVALEELKNVNEIKRAFIVTDRFLYTSGFSKVLIDKLSQLKITYSVYYQVDSDPTLSCAKDGAKAMKAFNPDCIIAFGGGSAMDAAKIMWVLYEHEEVDFLDMAMRFSDIRKRIYQFPKMGKKAFFVAIPTSAGTGSEVTPFAVITDDVTNIKYPLADYELMPNMAIIDVNLHLSAPKGLTSASGIDALTHALEAYASMFASDYTDSLAINAMKLILKWLPIAYEEPNNIVAREHMANAATIAGIAFANAFLGVCHSMAHKLGAYHHLPHGIANALMINHVIAFNASETPTKMGTFSAYDHPYTLKRYVQIADQLGLSGTSDKEKLDSLINEVEILKAKIGIRKTIKEYNIDEKTFLSTLDEMVENAFDDQCTGTNPRYPLMREIKQMYLDAYYGSDVKGEKK
jgi:acetaldehyde dehydrogenase/alcohol dehydrogenase